MMNMLGEQIASRDGEGSHFYRHILISTEIDNTIAIVQGSLPLYSMSPANGLMDHYSGNYEDARHSLIFVVHFLIPYHHVILWPPCGFSHYETGTEIRTNECSPHARRNQPSLLGWIRCDRILSEPAFKPRFLTCTLFTLSFQLVLAILRKNWSKTSNRWLSPACKLFCNHRKTAA